MPSNWPQWAFLGAVVALLLLFQRVRRAFWAFSLLVLPGTLAHEACHLVLGLLLNGRPAGFNLLPRRGEKGWELGSVGFAHITWYNAFFIGAAPLLLLPVAYGLMRWRLGLQPGFGWREGVSVYFIANLVYASLPSWQDWKIAARSPIGWLLLAGGIAWGWHRYAAAQDTAPRPPVTGTSIQV
ncbi:MAG: hypothetical protein ABSH53_18520 [Holophaga sp.]|jgi:hypothetical protein